LTEQLPRFILALNERSIKDPIMCDKRAAILDATLQLVSERGFHDAPMSLIAKEAGVSAGIIYHYFENKDELIKDLFCALKEECGRAISAGYEASMPLWEQFRLLWVNAVQYFLQHPKEAAFIEQFANSPYYTPEMEAACMVYYEPVFQFAARARRELVIKDLPDQVLYALTLEVAISLAQKHTVGLVEVTDDLIELVVSACWDSIRR
jgi:AcrR family transcriptional regulator